MMSRTSAVFKLAVGVREGKAMQGVLRRYANSGWIGAATVEVIAGPVIALQQAEKNKPQVETEPEPLRLVSNG